MIKRLIFPGLLILFIPILLGISQEAQVTKPEVQMAVTVDYRLVDVIVLNDDDEHILGLTKDNFKIWQNGVEQKILSLDEVNYLETDKIVPAESRMKFDGKVEKRDNLLSGQPVWHVLMIANIPGDMGRIKKFRDGLEDFIKDNLTPRDRMSIFVIAPDGVKRALGFTDDKKIILNSVNQLFANPAVMPPEMAYTMPETHFAFVKNLSDFVSQLDVLGGRKNIILFSAGMPDLTGADYMRHGQSVTGGSEQSDITKSYQLDALRHVSGQKKDLAEDLDNLELQMVKTNTSVSVVDLSAKTRTRSFDVGGSSGVDAVADSYNISSDARTEIQQRMSVDDENRLKLVRDIVSISGGEEVYLHSLYRSSKLTDYLEEIYDLNSHYYMIGYQPQGIDKKEGETIEDLKIEVVNCPNLGKVIYKNRTTPPQ